MVLEILVESKYKSSIEKKNQNEALEFSIAIQDINKSQYTIFTYSTKTDNINDARAISELKEKLNNGSHITIIRDESSSYFNKKLYPLINDFEIKLRSYIYIKNALAEEKLIDDKLKLDQKTLGQLIDLLFFDCNLYILIGDLIKNKHITKDELLSRINDFEENTLWNKLDVNNELIIVKEKYGEIEKNRNHVMHMHLISYNDYISAKKLFEEINTSLEEAIIKAKGLPLTQKQSVAFIDQLSAIRDLIDNSVVLKTPSIIATPIISSISAINAAYKPNNDLLDAMKCICQPLPYGLATDETLNRLYESIKRLEELEKLTKNEEPNDE